MLNEYSYDEIFVKHEIQDCPDDRGFPMHIHETCEIFLFISGKVEYLVEGSRYPLYEDSLMIMRPAEVHKPKILESTDYERYNINFPLSFVFRLDPEGMLLKPFLERPLGKSNFYDSEEIDIALVKRLFHEMCYGRKNEYERRLTITTHIYTLLDMISRAFSEKKTDEHSPKSLSERIIAYIEKHIADELSVPMLAEHFHLSASQFSRVFKQATGASPWEYIIKKRLTLARDRIRNGYTAQKACEACGFNDYSAFYRAYAKHFGCSPSEGVDPFIKAHSPMRISWPG